MSKSSRLALRRQDLLPSARNVHDQVLGSLLAGSPDWLHSPSLLENAWVIATTGKQFKRVKTQTLRFDAVVDRGGVRLTAPSRVRDLLTAKMVAFRMLQQDREGDTAYCMLLAYFWFIRWRLDIGIYSNADLVPQLFEEFLRKLRPTGRIGLIDFGPRVEDFKARVMAGTLDVKIYGGPYDPAVSMDFIAAELGMQEFQSLPVRTRADLIAFLLSRGYRLRGNTLDWQRRMPAQRTGLGQGSIQPMLDVWRQLWRHRLALGHDALPFDPFATKSFGGQLEAICTPARRTGSMPVEQASVLADRALRWVVDYSPEILRLLKEAHPILSIRLMKHRNAPYRRLMETARFSGPAAPNLHPEAFWRCRSKPSRGSVTLHDAAFHLLVTACAIVIALFSARRESEIGALRTDSLRKDDGGRDWLEVWVAKTLRDFETIPVPASVRRAFEVLCELSEPCRTESREAWLFDFLVPVFGSRVKFDFCRGLRLFASYCELPDLPGGGAWTFKPHQFRRFFSLIYTHAFEHGSLTALTTFLLHLDEKMTSRYTTDTTPGELSRFRALAEAQRRRLAEIAGETEAADSGRKHPSSRPNETYDYSAWYRPLKAAQGEGLAQVRRDQGHLPIDWEAAVKAFQRRVDILSPRSALPQRSFNLTLNDLDLASIRKAKEDAS